MTRVLVVDDEPRLRRALDVNLRARDYEVILADTGEQALRLAAREHPDVVVVDLGLPGIDGIEVIEGLRGWSDVPILVLSARETEQQKVAALDAGADDYVTKPFGMDEFLARIRAVERRLAATNEPTQPTVKTDHFVIDLAAKRVITNDGGPVHLTPTEWQLVEYLVRHEGQLVSHTRLLENVWGPGYDDETGYLRVHMSNIRRKLEPQPSHPRYFQTETGMGYRFENS